MNNPSEVAVSTQKIASSPELNVMLSASAGTGKTKVLTDRFIRLMLGGSPPEKILCITFTNAAALEMKERISTKLKQWGDSALESVMEELEKIGEDPKKARIASNLHRKFKSSSNNLKIMTIHALCGEIITRFNDKNNFKLKIMEPYEAKSYTYKIIKDYVAKLLECSGELLDYYLLLIDYTSPASVINLIEELAISCSNISSRQELEFSIYKAHKADVAKTHYNVIKEAYSHFKLHKKRWENLEFAISQIKPQKKLTELIKEIDINTWWEYYIDYFFTKDNKLRSKLVNKEFTEKYSLEYKFLMEQQELAFAFFNLYKRQLCAQLNLAIAILAKDCQELLSSSKQRDGLLTFDDLIIKTLDLLKKSPKAPGILYDLDYQINHLLVDEAQDTNAIQWQVIKTITDEFFAGEGARDLERTIFIVGDAKQSIYSFQGASPQLFNETAVFYEEKVINSSQKWQHLNMQVSFRSTQGVLNLVNSIFNKITLHQYPEKINHIANREGEGIVQLWPLVEIAKEKNETWLLPSKKIVNEESIEVANYIANKAFLWLKERKFIISKGRSILPKDIMILVRKRGNIVSSLRRSFRKYGIPIIECSKMKLKDHIIAQDMIALLKFVVEQDDDLNLASLLKSPFFNLSEQDLFNLCYNRSASIWANMEFNKEAYKELSQIILLKRASISKCLLKVLFDMEKINNFITRFGNEAYQVISTFLDVIQEFERKYSKVDYKLFLEWFDSNEIELQFSDESSDSVRIMTVHAAKGLQSPIVILADAASTEYRPVNKTFWVNDIPIISFNSKYDDEIIKILKDDYSMQQKIESNRLLYVAITRAEDEIYAIGCKNNRYKGSWYEILNTHAVSD